MYFRLNTSLHRALHAATFLLPHSEKEWENSLESGTTEREKTQRENKFKVKYKFQI